MLHPHLDPVPKQHLHQKGKYLDVLLTHLFVSCHKRLNYFSYNLKPSRIWPRFAFPSSHSILPHMHLQPQIQGQTYWTCLPTLSFYKENINISITDQSAYSLKKVPRKSHVAFQSLAQYAICYSLLIWIKHFFKPEFSIVFPSPKFIHQSPRPQYKRLDSMWEIKSLKRWLS
jgi:hypothetical protein